MCTCLRGPGIRVTATTEPTAIPPSAGCTRSTFLPRSTQCPSKGLKFPQMTRCSSTTGPFISAKPTSSPRRRRSSSSSSPRSSSPHKLTTTSPSCSLTLRTDGFSIATVRTPVPALWRRLTMTLTLTAPFESGTSTPTAAAIREPSLADRVERRLGTTTSLAMFSRLGRSTAL